jgi:hypothetical protein
MNCFGRQKKIRSKIVWRTWCKEKDMGRLRPYLISLLNLFCQREQQAAWRHVTLMIEFVCGGRENELRIRDDDAATAQGKRNAE